MSVFPQFGKINPKIAATINSRIGNNVEVSKLMPWFRISSAGHVSNEKNETVNSSTVADSFSNFADSPNAFSVHTAATIKESKGLILESIPVNNSFVTSYGGIIDKERKSGRVGTDFNGGNVYATGTDRAHRPSPTIDSLSIENGNRGLSKKARFSITCYTLAQADTVSAYFLEPGFIVMVEFGFNKTKSIAEKINLAGENGPCNIARCNNYEYLLNKRINSDGTYDGFMGYITDGGMSNGDNETFIIDVELTTLGEIPAYLQIHKGGSDAKLESGEVKSSKQPNAFETSDIKEASKNNDTIGRALFMQMYNRLPAEKQTLPVKALIDGIDYKKTSWASKENFINMDEEVREKIAKSGGDAYDTKDGPTITLPDGIDFITNQAFIRVELAFEILNSYIIKLERTGDNASKCKVQPFNFLINGKHTILRAHKNMFSTDLSKVYIPNSNLPEFGLESALIAEDSKSGNDFIDVNALNKKTSTTNGCFFEALDKYAFPSTVKLVGGAIKDAYDIKAPIGEWGYLRNLYINFDFFLEVLNKSNLVAKDIYYELLNGISSAVNSYWEFDFFETTYNPSNEKKTSSVHPMELAIWDTTFTGTINKGNVYTKWQMTGTNSPFLSAKMDISIPAAMRNHTLGKRSSGKILTQTEGNPQHYIFAQNQDRVLAILNSFKIIDDTAPKKTETTPSSKKEVRKSNLDLFLGRALMIPKIQDRNKVIGEKLWLFNQQLSNVFLIAGWNDSTLLNEVRLFNEGEPSNPISNPAILGIGFEFEIIGTSGIKVGDMFKIVDLPKQYRDHGIFQVMEISHSLSSSMWKTTVHGQMRNMKS